MGLITENELRKLLKDQDLSTLKEYKVEKGTIITPSAQTFLTDRHIKLSIIDKSKDDQQSKNEKSKTSSKADEKNQSQKPEPVQPFKYRLLNGGYTNQKPEQMTALYGNVLVNKDHNRIIFRGKLDSFESKILESQIKIAPVYQGLADDLQEVLDFVRNLVRCEVLNSPVKEIKLLGMSEQEIREMSHHPKKFFGEGHFFPDYRLGEPVILLNSLRSMVREAEIAAYQAFKKENGEAEREDIIQALNRLSSLFWVLMFKTKTGSYSK
ncbi:cobalamin adenosyltransferase [Mesobacillus zeae]|uniref:Cobalamin adenosyltransferase n=1 Tax=Mesobacillus zeae TaxID=1917180 RepID=A0A398BF87_9BACI|nr:cobalamin adenosyltransferase [Mesobacillus zeae]RID86340.1 cobalamin adenosyltransferase [Mesobacillus zeae]